MATLHVAAVNEVDKNKYHYSKVSLSLENCILPSDKICPSPSHTDGLERDIETELRILGCELIQTSGILLRLPQVAMATGQVLFQRFYYSKSFVRHTMEVVAMACVTLASKIEEAPRRIRDVVNVFHHIKQVKAGKTIQPLILDQNYINLKNQVIKAERRVLKELGFCVHVKHPHKIIVTLLEVLKVKNKKLMQTAWNYMNDSLRSEVFVRYDPETIACGCIFLSARLLQIPLPNKPAWYLVFGVSEQDINAISHTILSLYTRKKPDTEKLEKIVEELRKAHQEAKMKAKGLIALSALNNLSPNNSQTASPRNNGIKSPLNDSKKDKSDSKHNDISPKYSKELNHRKHRSPSPIDDDYQSSGGKKRNKTSSSGSVSSHSPSPKRSKKTPPRSFKESRHSRSRSRSKTRTSKKSKRRSSHKRKRSHSLSPLSPSNHHSSSKKSYKNKHSEKSHHVRSHSKSPHERTNHHTNSVYEKPHKSRKEKVKENHHSREKKRR